MQQNEFGWSWYRQARGAHHQHRALAPSTCSPDSEFDSQGPELHWPDLNRFLMRVTDGRIRTCQQGNIAYTSHSPFDGGSAMIWGFLSPDITSLLTVPKFLKQNAISNILGPDLNTLEHIWDILGRKIQKLDPPVDNLQEMAFASRMSKPTPGNHQSSDLRHEKEGWGGHPGTWRLYTLLIISSEELMFEP